VATLVNGVVALSFPLSVSVPHRRNF